MILSGPAIYAAVERGFIDISPFDESRLNPASYDLELGDEVGIYAVPGGLRGYKRTLDSKHESPFMLERMDRTEGFTVEPGYLYLMHTRERISTKRFVPVLDGKSSIGRLGVLVHVTAGYGDPGFDGQYTLEVTSIAHPVVLYPGMLIAQMRFHDLVGEPHYYNGNYQGATSTGPVPSASWRQFR